MKIVNLDGYTTNPGDLSWDFLYKYSDDIKIYDRTPQDKIIERAKGAEILLINKTEISGQIIEALVPDLKFIALQSTGFNVIDLNSAKQNNVIVSNIPKYSTDAVAQLVFAFILSFSNKVDLHSKSVFDGEWCRCPDFCYLKSPIFELSNKTIGIIGYGSIGSTVAKIANAFGMNVLVYTRTPKSDSSVKFTSFDYLLKKADIITCHCPLTPETKNLFDYESISKMKKTAYLINTSRGDVVNENALADALNNDNIAGAACDVLTKEPAVCDNPLLRAKNCIITPHIAWAGFETRKRLIEILDKNVQAYIDGNPQNTVY